MCVQRAKKKGQELGSLSFELEKPKDLRLQLGFRERTVKEELGIV